MDTRKMAVARRMRIRRMRTTTCSEIWKRDAEGDEEETALGRGKKGKEVRFMEADEIQGQVEHSKSGGHVSANFALDPKGKTIYTCHGRPRK